jgi:hypothetical protein
MKPESFDTQLIRLSKSWFTTLLKSSAVATSDFGNGSFPACALLRASQLKAEADPEVRAGGEAIEVR